MKAIILAGGLGTRLRPLTLQTPKPLLLIKGKPILEYAILNFRKYGIEDIVLSIGYQADQIKAYFGDGGRWGVRIGYCIEDEPLGTGGAIKKAAADTKTTFVAINGDNLADFNWREMLEFHRKNKARLTLALCSVEDVTQFGIARLAGDEILEFVEKPTKARAPSNLNNAGGYVIEPEVLEMLPPGASSLERDCFEKIAPQGKVFAYLHAGQWFPTDTLGRYQTAEQGFNPPSNNI